METIMALFEPFCMVTTVALLGLSQSLACFLWTRDDPLFVHHLCRVPFIAGFISFGAMTFVSISGATSELSFFAALFTGAFLILAGINHQAAVTKIVMQGSKCMTKSQYFVTEVVLLGFLGSVLMVIVTLASNGIVSE